MDILLVTCEHAGNRIPAAYRSLFQAQARLLRTHRGYDIGAAELFGKISAAMADDRYACMLSRLLIDPNRSLNHPALFSAITRPLPRDLRAAIVRQYYLPYREAVETAVARRIGERQRVLHISVHTFTPVLDRRVRTADIGLLYDPQRRIEKKLSRVIRKNLRTVLPELRVRMNYPYAGIADGLVSSLRRKFPPSRYCGMELEVNQKFWTQARCRKNNLLPGIVRALQAAFARE
ncbi:MAG: N-formylglutamate amidohydrolase [Candidatus Omnitrophica bacterium]|nr:N-formylglutamate amidohydrolase [Candidatus Omnitrophota bacterium]